MSATSERASQMFRETYGRPPSLIAEAPGRVNLIGEHTDYNLGYVMPVAIDRTVAVAAAPRDDGLVRVQAADYEQGDEFRADAPRRFPHGGWRNYVRGVAWALLDAGHALRGADVLIAGDVPQGTGLSSSAALEVAVGGALAEVSGLTCDGRSVALAGQRAENGFVGIQSGIMDQLASALGQANHALFIDCRSLDVEPVPLPDPAQVAIVVIESGVARKIEETAYNRRREECDEAARLLGIASLRDADAATLDRLPGEIYRRACHVISENKRVLQAAEALRTGDIAAVGRLLYESHKSLRDDFEVSTPELDLLVDLARRTEGVFGARLTGAGFGGCAVSLVATPALAQFGPAVVEEYRRRTGLPAQMHVCAAVDGLRVTHG